MKTPARLPSLVDSKSRFKIRSTPISSFSTEELVSVLRNMLLVRRLDEKMMILLKQGRGHFHVGCSGHEAVQLASAFALDRSKDWAAPYYRDLAFAVGFGLTARDILSAHLSKITDPSGGRQMPSHFNSRKHRIVSVSSSIGAQFLPGLGIAQATLKQQGDEVTYISTGEGGTSQGVFFELLNWASICKAPLITVVQDNKYAISVPLEEQTSNRSISRTIEGFEHTQIIEVDGTDFFNSHAAVKKAAERARNGQGPTVIHAHVVRLVPHSSSDDPGKYRSAEELESEKLHDPLEKFKERLLSADLITEGQLDALAAEVHEQVEQDTRWVMAQEDPKAEDALLHVLSEDPPELLYEKNEPSGEQVVMVDAINHCLHEEMERNEHMLVFGEDVADGKGGVFTATRGLTERFGKERCYNSPLSEASILGAACGLAIRGFKPVVEIQFGDYIWPAMEMVKNQIDTLRYRSCNQFSAPMVIRIPVGGYIHGGLCHSQNIEATFAHFPGFKVVMPSNAADAKGLLRTAIRSDDPIVFLEHKGLYRQGFARSAEPDAEYMVPIGKASVLRTGSDLTIVTYGALVQKSLNAAREFAGQGTQIEVIDLRSIQPLDMQTVIASLKKTGRLVIVHEDYKFMGLGAEIAAQITEEAFEWLDAPVKRVAARFSPIPYAPALEDFVLPNDRDIAAAVQSVLHF